VASDQVVTNRHVVAEGVSLRIRQGSRTWPAIVTHLDADHDLCRLKAEGLNTSPVGVRRSSSLQVGERVYAIGAPEGLELTLSEGLVSGLRDNEGVRIIQTTAPVSAGSSGGGLFDAQGRLVGITTFIVAEGQNLNFALPGDWVLALDNHAVSGKPKTKAESLEFQALVWALRGYREGEAGKHEQAVQAFREAIRLKPDYADAWYNLGVANRESGQYQEAVQACREAIRLKPDDAEAWYNLGVAYARQGNRSKVMEAYQ
jgi:tetratricopeptide (TPR) repeat protein